MTRRQRALVGATAALVVAAALIAGAAPLQAEENWATQRAAELSTQGDSHRDGGQIELAMERYRQAIEIDPTFGASYLSLGGLREAMGDADEAERTYTAGIDHIAGFAEGYLARATLRLRASRGDEAIADLDAALALRPTDVAIIRRLRDASITLGKLPLALAMSRRLAAVALSAGDAAAEHEARVTVTALLDIVGFVDPVVDGEDRNPTRKALARALGTHHSNRGKRGGGTKARPQSSSSHRSSAAPSTPSVAPAPAPPRPK